MGLLLLVFFNSSYSKPCFPEFKVYLKSKYIEIIVASSYDLLLRVSGFMYYINSDTFKIKFCIASLYLCLLLFILFNKWYIVKNILFSQNCISWKSSLRFSYMYA